MRFTRREINERILETPFILNRVSVKPINILDVGACESPLALMLASMGHNVTALDLRKYPFTHPNLTSTIGDITKFHQAQKFDLVICLSTLEHIGLEVYGGKKNTQGDYLAIKNIYKLLKPGGKLLLTTPLADMDKTHELWKEFSQRTLIDLLAMFSRVKVLIGEKRSDQNWHIVDKLTPKNGNTPTGVALVEAFK
jgi:2-polyprenyl-3-methyl-5-hydroxy-6-metoxy-1,4-benzoquinol methylase